MRFRHWIVAFAVRGHPRNGQRREGVMLVSVFVLLMGRCLSCGGGLCLFFGDAGGRDGKEAKWTV